MCFSNCIQRDMLESSVHAETEQKMLLENSDNSAKDKLIGCLGISFALLNVISNVIGIGTIQMIRKLPYNFQLNTLRYEFDLV